MGSNVAQKTIVIEINQNFSICSKISLHCLFFSSELIPVKSKVTLQGKTLE
jgi:hypothetical protein